MSQIKNLNIERLPEFLKDAIDASVHMATDEEITKAIKRIDARRDEIIAGVVLHVQRMITVEKSGNVLSIQVQVEKDK